MQTDSPLATAVIEPGTPMHGGFYAGRIRIAGALFGLIVSPKDRGDSKAAWSPGYVDVPAAASYCDGQANTVAMSEAGLPIAKWVQALAIDGHTDWYLPSRDELELMYRYLKPTEETNYTYRSGENPSADPPTYPYAENLPLQTPALAFREGGAEALETAGYWSSTQYSRDGAWLQLFVDGYQGYGGKSYGGRARAVRRFSIA